ncbi:MAG: InlB B-repeat-containing protein, partial [Clostridia bacterium]|nr:InlB B-repeat-containing protein [Clostridia bacterium]
TFDTDGGSAIDPITGDYGDAITAPADPTKEGYTFTGWVDADGNAADIPATMPDEDVALKATWAVNSYKVVYTSDEETFADYDVNYGAAIPVPAVPTKTGYTFGG